MNATVTKSQLAAAVQLMGTVCEIIREAGSVPSGTLYAGLNAKGLDLQAYNAMIERIKSTGLVTEKGNLLTWNGPKF